MRHRSGLIGRGTTYPLYACSNFNSGGGGFDGYPPGQSLPSLLDIMNGNGTNSPRIELTTNPDSTYAYSGQGFVLLQRMIEEVSGQDFADYMNQEIFTPLRMKHSTYALSVPQDWISQRQIAAGHTLSGDVIPGKRNFYPESAAAGLYTSVEDLIKIIIYLNRKWNNTTTQGPLSLKSVQTLLSGRGFAVSGNSSDPNFSYSHDGDNFGFQCIFRGYPNLGEGYAIMTNSDNNAVVQEAVEALKSVYGWS